MRYVKIQSNLGKIAEAIPEARVEAMLQTGADIVSIIKQIVPVKSGELRHSYGATPISSNEVQIGTRVEYAPFVEYGNSRGAPAQPHLTPAMAQAAPTFKKRLQDAIEKRIRR